MADDEKKNDELEGAEASAEGAEDEVPAPVAGVAVAPTEDDSDDYEYEDDDSGEYEGDDSGEYEDDDSDDAGADDEDAETDEIAAAVATGATPEAAEEKPAGKAKRRKKKTGRKKRAPKTTAGERLAAAKAAKAARKIRARGKDADEVEDKAAEQAQAATRWLERNRQKLMMGLAAALIIAVGIFAWGRFARAGDAEAAGSLWEAMEIANARILDPESEDEEVGDDETTFENEASRAEAAIAAFESVISDHGGTRAAAFAHIGRGNALRALERGDDAKAAYEAALAESDDPEVTLRALEGLGFVHENDEAWDEAEARFEEMGGVERSGARILADYHLARLSLAQEEIESAKEKLQALLESLDEEDAPEMEFVRDQAEMRLREIDPSLVQSTAPSMMPGMGGPGGGLGGAGDQMTPEMQRMIQELLQKQQQGQ